MGALGLGKVGGYACFIENLYHEVQISLVLGLRRSSLTGVRRNQYLYP